jgi:hypothetical protein
MEDKFYHIKDFIGMTASTELISRWNPSFCIEIDENAEARQCVLISLFRKGKRVMDKPKNTKYTKVKPILPDIYQSYFATAIKLIAEQDYHDCEYYIEKQNDNNYEIACCPKSTYSGRSITIRFCSNDVYFDLAVDCVVGHKKRGIYRRKATPISEEHFSQFLNLTIGYLYDQKSYLVLVDELIKNFNILISEDTKIKDLHLVKPISINKINDQLMQRKVFLEKQLFENDKATAAERSGFRSELAGIEYALATIKTHT